MTACIPRINLPWALFADEETEAKRVCPCPGAQAGGIKLYKCVLKGLEPRSQWQGVFRAALPPEDPGRIPPCLLQLLAPAVPRLMAASLWPLLPSSRGFLPCSLCVLFSCMPYKG